MSIVSVPSFCSSISDSTICGNCLKGNRIWVHRVPIHRIYVNLCTSCVVRLHPQLFCPTCFGVYESPDEEENVVICCKCCSSTHLDCVRPKSPDPYICSTCIDPDSLIYDVDRMKNGENGGMILLAATEILVSLTRKVADAAWVEAETKAALAAESRKKAREALEHSANIAKKENLRGDRVDELASVSAEEPGSSSSRRRGRGHGHGRGRGRGMVGGRRRGAGHGLAEGDSDFDSSDSDYGSDPDYDGSKRSCKRKKLVKNSGKKVGKKGKDKI